MSITSRIMARMYKLPPAETYDIAVDRNLEVPMADGVVLRADRYYPRHSQNLPTLLIRTPYGRSRFGIVWGQLFPERGFQVLIQSCRGTDDSGGDFTPFRGEREDGLATLEWLKTQDWFDGKLAMAGPSYLGFTQWAIARDAGPVLKALSTQNTSSEFRSAMYPGRSFNLELFLKWMQVTYSFRGSMLNYLGGMVGAGRRMKTAVSHLPLNEADEIVVGNPMKFWRDWLQHTEPNDGWWASEDYSHGVADVSAPNHLISGWYDFLLPQLLRDYTTLEHAGRNPYLTIGPWSHSSNGFFEVSLRESLLWLRAHLLGETKKLRTSPVRIYVMGADEWRDLKTWPPSDTQTQRWYLQPEAALTTDIPPDSQASQFRYDPRDPTPNVGGAINATLGRGAGAQDNRTLEARPDVLVFTSPPLSQDMEVIGPVSAELFVRSSLEHTDFFIRLCDVHTNGKSMNVCDGLLRLFPGRPAANSDGCRKVVIDLWPTAHRFKAQHRIRVQVSSGAFPRFARNLGTGELLATGTTMKVAEQSIFHDPDHPSAVILSLV
ncbi:MAG: CocE/NonD family hydrolase [Theionarchaea archaeon]|nr:MAG: X-Pro dipeptidyl-peptidase [Theionarchaea archaeon DG-70]MBU7009536.1 CocE/NonD family hydrolase [Theionarchaea archaeon]